MYCAGGFYFSANMANFGSYISSSAAACKMNELDK